jgi:hypothetical protein
MSLTVNVAFVQQFKDNVIHLCQQKGSRLRGFVQLKENLVGKQSHFERLASTSVVKRTTRHGDTPLVSSTHSRRRVTMNDYEWADLVDKQDEIRMLINPKSDYAMTAAWAMGRQMDTDLFTAANGNSVAVSSSDAGSNVALGSGQKVAIDFGGTTIGITLAKIRNAKRILDAAECPTDSRFLSINAQMLEEMLGVTEIASADYNTVKALVGGEVDTFLGFYWVRTELCPWLSQSADSRISNAIQGSGLGLAIGQDVVTRIDERTDKSYSTQVYLSMTFGATRVEEEKVVQIACDMSP